jgi:hypothetical protein
MFDTKEDNFEITYKETVMQVERLKLAGYNAFRVVFNNSKRQPLVVARATNANAVHFWTSIPEGRQKEAQGMGKLIEEYFQSQKQ